MSIGWYSIGWWKYFGDYLTNTNNYRTSRTEVVPYRTSHTYASGLRGYGIQ